MLLATRFLDFDSVIARTSLSRSTLERLIAKGELQPARAGRRLLFLEQDVLDWMEARLAERPHREASQSRCS